MKEAFLAVKNLYSCENPIKRHLKMCLLLLIPSLLSATLGFIDKDTPKTAMVVLVIASAVLLILSIIPWIFLLGLSMEFVRDRLDNLKGIPQVTMETFIKGLKILPVSLTWMFYTIVGVLTILAIPFIPLIVTQAKSVGAIIFAIIGFIVALLLLTAIMILVIPFINYLYSDYVKNGSKLAGYLFNPIRLVYYMKKAFKSTIFVELKFIVVGMAASMIYGIFGLFIAVIVIGLTIVAAIFAPESKADTIIYTPVLGSLVILISSLASLVQIYISTMTAYAAADRYIDVYKNEIATTEE